MKIILRSAGLIIVVLVMLISTALANYPGTMDNGNLVLVDGGMGTARYADRSSVVVEKYAPPDYQIAINVVFVSFSEEYWKKNKTYIGGPYKFYKVKTMRYRYNWNRKIISYQKDGQWMDWDVNHEYGHAGGDPFIPNTAEVAFVSAYNMRFFDKKQHYSPSTKSYYPVIDESLYNRLGI